MAGRSERRLSPFSWLVCVITTVLAAAAGFGLSHLQAKSYSASAQVLFSNPGIDQVLLGKTLTQTSAIPDQDTATNLALAASRDVAAKVAPLLHTTTDHIVSHISVTQRGASDVVNIAATASSANHAATLANDYARAFVQLRTESTRGQILSAQKQLVTQYDATPSQERLTAASRALHLEATQLAAYAAVQTGNVQISQNAQPPTAASEPRPVRAALVGALLGLIVGGLSVGLLRPRTRRLPDDPAGTPTPA
jgi:uncharacterized protein involved in exopolysaccharide biosynthesis